VDCVKLINFEWMTERELLFDKNFSMRRVLFCAMHSLIPDVYVWITRCAPPVPLLGVTFSFPMVCMLGVIETRPIYLHSFG